MSDVDTSAEAVDTSRARVKKHVEGLRGWLSMWHTRRLMLALLDERDAALAAVEQARRDEREACAALADGEWCCECPQMLDVGEVCCGSPLRVCDTALPSRIRARGDGA